MYSAYARARLARERIAAVSCAPSESANLLITEPNDQNSFLKRFCRLINETIVFFFHNTIGYAVMLGVMMYSGWIFVAVILGMGFGYFFFGHVTMKINMESIHARTAKVICSQACPEANCMWNAFFVSSWWSVLINSLFDFILQQAKLHHQTGAFHINNRELYHQQLHHAMRIKLSAKHRYLMKKGKHRHRKPMVPMKIVAAVCKLWAFLVLFRK